MQTVSRDGFIIVCFNDYTNFIYKTKIVKQNLIFTNKSNNRVGQFSLISNIDGSMYITAMYIGSSNAVRISVPM